MLLLVLVLLPILVLTGLMRVIATQDDTTEEVVVGSLALLVLHLIMSMGWVPVLVLGDVLLIQMLVLEVMNRVASLMMMLMEVLVHGLETIADLSMNQPVIVILVLVVQPIWGIVLHLMVMRVLVLVNQGVQFLHLTIAQATQAMNLGVLVLLGVL